MRSVEGISAVHGGEEVNYYPHPDTKQVHHQPASVFEVFAPPLGSVCPGDCFELCVDERHCRLIQPA